MSDEQKNETLRTSSGSAKLDHRVVTAEGKGKSALSATRFAGSALILLIVICGYAFIAQKDGAKELLALIGTVFGLFVGRYSHHDG